MENQDIEHIYKRILNNLNEEERNHSEYWQYNANGFFQYQKGYNKDTLSLNIKIKENRKDSFFEILNNLNITYKISNVNKYYIIVELKKDFNYIVIDFVVNSHVTIPKSFLKHFSRNTLDGKYIDYININTLKIEQAKINEYGTSYGYYSKITEEFLSKNFEEKIARITKEIHDFRNKKIDNIDFTKEKLDNIYDFFNITTYRNPKCLKEFNNNSLSSKIVGGFTHDYLMSLIANMHPTNVYKELNVDVLINRTERNFIISDNMISSVMIDKENSIIVLPINTKESLVLMTPKMFKKYYRDNRLYFICIDSEKEIEYINKQIYERAKINKENVIGTKYELEKLI